MPEAGRSTARLWVMPSGQKSQSGPRRRLAVSIHSSVTKEWIDTAKRRLGPLCDFCPEGITHNLAVDLPASGIGASRLLTTNNSPLTLFAQGETQWSQHQ